LIYDGISVICVCSKILEWRRRKRSNRSDCFLLSLSYSDKKNFWNELNGMRTRRKRKRRNKNGFGPSGPFQFGYHHFGWDA
jgi:hypothetical protein